MHRNGFALHRVVNNNNGNMNGHNNHNGYHNGYHNNLNINHNNFNNHNNHHNHYQHQNGSSNGHCRRRTVSSGETENGHSSIYHNGKHHNGKQDGLNKDALKIKTVDKVNLTLNQYRKEGKFCDFELRVSDKVFPVHKLILAVSSAYFDVMFNNKENFIENETNSVDLHEIDPLTCELLLHFMYTGEIDVNSHNVQDIARFSNMFELMELVDYCSKFLESNLDISNCIGILRFADFYGFQALYFKAKHFVENLFAEVSKEEEFLELPATLLRSFLRSESLSIESEYQVLSSTLNWIMKDDAERLKYLEEFVDLIRMPLITPEQIKTFADNCSHAEILKTLNPYLQTEKVTKPQANTEDSVDAKNPTDYNLIRQKPRMKSRRRIYVLGGLSIRFNERQQQSSTSMVKWNLHTGSWDQESPFFYPRSSHCVVKLSNKIYLIGGECDSLILDTMEVFDLEDQTSLSETPRKWARGASMNQPRSSFGACVHGGQIYVFGGKTTNGQLIEQYDPRTRKWSYHGQMPIPRYGMQVVEHENLIYIIGGRTCHLALNSLMTYSPDTKEFRELAPMNNARSDFGCAILHDRIVVIGGLDANHEPLTTVEQYDIAENKWSFLAPLNARRSAMCAVSIDDKIYTFGGQHINAPWGLKCVDVYDPDKNKWFSSKPMPQNRTEAAVVLV